MYVDKTKNAGGNSRQNSKIQREKTGRAYGHTKSVMDIYVRMLSTIGTMTHDASTSSVVFVVFMILYVPNVCVFYTTVSDAGGRSKSGQSRSMHIFRKMASFASNLSRPFNSVSPSNMSRRPKI